MKSPPVPDTRPELTVRITPDLRRRLEERARAEDRTLSWCVREAVKAWIK